MKFWRFAVLVLVVGLGAFGCALQPSNEDGWIALIDGASGLENWNRIGDANWRSEAGAVAANAGNGYLVSKRTFRNFRLRAEFWADDDTNSGIFLRVGKPGEITPTSSYEVNIFDRRPDPSYGTGAIVGVAKVIPSPRVSGQWNTYDITARGTHIVVTLNGTRTVDIEDASFAAGPIALQAAGGTIKWRLLKVQPL